MMRLASEWLAIAPDEFAARATAHPKLAARTDYWHLARAAYAVLRDREEGA
jgi:hypothetical protein